MNKEYRKRIRVALDYISRNADQDLTLDMIAEKANFSKYHFHRIFKAVTGETIYAHIRRLRLENAANRILADSGESITTIAFNCGFGSSQHFATAFKKQFGFSPRKFRDQYSPEVWAEKRDDQKNSYTCNTTLDSSLNGSNDEARTNLWINLMEMPAYRVAYKRVVGPYGLKNSEAVFKKLFKWAYLQFNTDEIIALGIIWDNPGVTVPEQCRYDACITVPDRVAPKGSIGIQEVRGGQYVVAHCEVSSYTELEQAYEDIFIRWFPTSNYAPANAVAYEIYLNNPANHPRESLLIDICIPVEKI